MNLGNLTIKSRIAFGFGLLVILLSIIGSVCFFGVGGIVANAKEVITGNKLDATLVQFEVDNLTWTRDINLFLTDNTVTKADVDTTGGKSRLGLWLEGTGSKDITRILPALSKPLEKLNTLNKQVYLYSDEIKNAYKGSDDKLPAHIVVMHVSLMKWAATIRDTLIKRTDVLNVETDATKSKLGVWMTSKEGLDLLTNGDDELRSIWTKLDISNKKLHKTALKINEDISFSPEVGAMDFEQTTLPLLNETVNHLGDLKKWAEKALEGNRTANLIYAKKLLPQSKEIHITIEAMREVVRKTIITDEKMLSYALKVRFLVILLVTIALATGLTAGYFVSESIINILKDLADEMTDSSERLASASSQIQDSSQQLADGAAEQTASLEESASSMEEMAIMTKSNAENSNNAYSLMHETSKIIDRTSNSMEELTGSMETILKTSEQTSHIIKTIDGIAFQTNLLALNASVEAARAGVAGAGFAVVADEVRNLALKSAEAAKDTTHLVQEIVGQIEHGSKIVKETNDAFGEVESSSSRANDLISEISASSSEQATGIDQVNKAINQMGQITNDNTANAEETASSSVDMGSLSKDMKNTVDKLQSLVGAKKVFNLLNFKFLKGAEEKKTKALQIKQSRIVEPNEILDEAVDF
jgi:methyl-accepting chemotaxis protein